MSAQLQRPCHLVEDPKHFFGVFQHLVRHDQISLAVGERKRLAFDIGNVDIVSFASQTAREVPPAFDGDQSRSRMVLSDDSQVPPGPGSQINDHSQILQPTDKILHYLRSEALTLVCESPQPM